MTIGYQFGGNSNGITPPASTPIPSSLTIDSLSSFKFVFDISLTDQRSFDGGYENMFFEMYPANAAGSGVSLSREFSVVLHMDAGSFAYYGPSGGCITDTTCTIHANYDGPAGCPFTGYVTFLPANTSGGNTGGQIIMMKRDGTDFLSGCFDVKHMLAFVEAEGMLPSGKIMNGVEFLSELIANSGSWLVKCLGIDWNGTQYGAAAC